MCTVWGDKCLVCAGVHPSRERGDCHLVTIPPLEWGAEGGGGLSSLPGGGGGLGQGGRGGKLGLQLTVVLSE